jgi:tetraacyldisaccharide 4'-kinase
MSIRNILFASGFLERKQYKTPTFGVGNLSMGGTGKSVVIDYLINTLKRKYKTGTLSRGYGRSSKGFVLATSNATAENIGDEPFQFYKKHPEITVSVSEKRSIGLEAMEQLPQKSEVILLDDVLQHRWVKADFMILTTSYEKPFFKDFLFPVGSLRETRNGVNRADLILITLSPLDLTQNDKLRFLTNIKLNKNLPVFFTSISYNEHLKGAGASMPLKSLNKEVFVLVTGIADPSHLLDYLNKGGHSFEHMRFNDHHKFSSADCNSILEKAAGKHVLTTEKDFGRLASKLDSDQLFYLEISLAFSSKKEEKEFNAIIESAIKLS